MPVLNYGQTAIEWYFQLDTKLKRHYVTVERGRPVLLRGPLVGEPEQEAMVLRRARWIRERLAQVNQPLASAPIVTGSRLRYAGRTYFTEVRHAPDVLKPQLTFTASRFIVDNPDGMSIHPDTLMPLLEGFYRERADEKLLVRVRHWQRVTGLQATGARIRHFQSRWASCDANNTLEFHPRVMELPASVQDYVIVHELCHTVEKNHTKAFWTLVASHMPDWQKQHQVLERALYGDAV
ncbi:MULTISPECIES: SprT family zinc-dependent metalloprotease [unclassified Pseudomonas]|jgi:predicted metal-dependent hydrolase|uniref:YgjP family zinc-dependent metalloprotease n=1 Tax=unclassified Pseudomonas TaxID=196821 RepID=UPI000C877318|nr:MULTISPECIES: SprT family zinc-dependent metalloprotease [unclassified Pseudomonas]PMU93286.1 M48 family peptidase [Pseudomonas sp. GW704-F3]PMU96175.1 M48 family peptidase [Pseudomonas sp. GW704-F5]PMU99971.1 M48 family peptidase [Pseudomonas sp. MPBD4-3]PMV32899.1 M48 family peptidase [Pseudomonas sp. GW704-F2]